MKMSINKRIKRIFLEHKSAYLGMLVLIILSTNVFLGLKTSGRSIKKNVEDNRIEHNVEDSNLFYSKRLSEEDISEYEEKYNLKLEENSYVEAGYNKAKLRIREESKEINTATVYEG